MRLLLDRGAPSALLYLAVEDVEGTVARLRAAGVSVEGEPRVIFTHEDDTLGPAGTDEWMGFVRDSEGNLSGARGAASTRLTRLPVTMKGMRPQVVAHRGASHDNAEHTLGAYVAALDAGAEALECDVRLTADGHLVCVHDRDLRRTARTRGPGLHHGASPTSSELDFAPWKNPWADLDDEAPDRDAGDGSVLTLRKLLETVADYDRRVEVAIETKHPTRYGGLVERRVVDLLRDFGWDRPAARPG